MPVLRVRKGAEPGRVHAVLSAAAPTIVGREGAVDVPLNDPKSSRRHAAIRLERGRWIVEDLGSSNGTILDGGKVKKAELRDGATLQLGGTLLSFHENELSPPPPGEIHGARPSAALREEAGIFVFIARQAAMDRPVRVDWAAPSREVPRGVHDAIEATLRGGQRVSGAGIIPLLAAGTEPEGGTFAILKGAPRPTLEEKLPVLLTLSLDIRLEFYQRVVEIAFERAALEGALGPIHTGHIEVGTDASGTHHPFLPVIDLQALFARETGSLPHLPRFGPYLPPEWQHGENPRGHGAASLAYCLGAIGYHLLTGHRAAGDGSLEEMHANHAGVAVAPPSLLEPRIPPSLSSILALMLDKAPARRPTRVEDVLGAFPLAIPAERSPPVLAVTARVTPLPTAPPPPAAETPEPRRGDPPAKPTPPPARRGQDARQSAMRKSPAPKPAESAAKTAPPVKKASSGLLYLPAWLLLWLALFFAARHLSRLVFEKTGPGYDRGGLHPSEGSQGRSVQLPSF
ncbi:MAG TPA: serine/threonine-protein kinase [Planctomycetota bacterium]|nr:serine/threonine-protein kinase [Planctomycetota bacterium]